jgi:hypothetical protein
MKNLTSAKARQQPLAQMTEAIKDLDERLRLWYENIPQALRPQLPLKLSGLPQGVQLEHVLYLYFAYHGSLIAIHSVFLYPWNFREDESSSSPYLWERIDWSGRIVAEASRQLILATRYIEVDTSAPIW